MNKFLLLGLLLASPGFSATFFLTTDQTGANTTIDLAHSSTWLLVPNTPFDLGGGNFELKRGPATDKDIVLSLYQGTDATGPLLAQATVSFTVVGQGPGYVPYDFLFTSAVPLLSGTSYFATLTSDAGTPGNQQYFVKDGGAVIVDDNGDPVSPDPIGGTVTPEPSTFALLGMALVGAGAYRRIRR